VGRGVGFDTSGKEEIWDLCLWDVKKFKIKGVSMLK
jgi:hypothetical protein